LKDKASAIAFVLLVTAAVNRYQVQLGVRYAWPAFRPI